MKTSLLKVMIFFFLLVSPHSVHSKSIHEVLKETETKYYTRISSTLFGSKIIKTPHFLVHYKRSVVSDYFAKQVALLCEYSRETYIRWGFKEPSPLIIHVYINTQFKKFVVI